MSKIFVIVSNEAAGYERYNERAFKSKEMAELYLQQLPSRAFVIEELEFDDGEVCADNEKLFAELHVVAYHKMNADSIQADTIEIHHNLSTKHEEYSAKQNEVLFEYGECKGAELCYRLDVTLSLQLCDSIEPPIEEWLAQIKTLFCSAIERFEHELVPKEQLNETLLDELQVLYV